MARRSFVHRVVNFVDFNYELQVPLGYNVIKCIGKGAFGIVVHATDANGRHVAIKRLLNPFDTPYQAKCAYREFELLQIVNHKNVVQLYDAYTPQENLEEFCEIYFVMEYMEQPLRFLIDERARNFQEMSGGRSLSYFLYQLLCGVNHLHQAGIVHRDLRPENIMIDSTHKLKIIDFGIARIITGTQGASIPIAHPFYRAPELFLTVNFNNKVDVWSIGCIFGELINGQILFEGRNNPDQLMKIINMLGTPSDAYLSTLITDAQTYVRGFPYRQAIAWDQIFPDNNFPPSDRDFCSASNGKSLLSRMLVFDPEQRISIEDALKHPYVTWKHIPGEIDSQPRGVYAKEIEQRQLTTDQLKQIIFERMQEYEIAHQN